MFRKIAASVFGVILISYGFYLIEDTVSSGQRSGMAMNFSEFMVPLGSALIIYGLYFVTHTLAWFYRSYGRDSISRK